MVLQQSRPLPKAPPRLDSTRILGISSTLALNVIALSMLLMPMTLPPPPASPAKPFDWEWIDPPRKVEPKKPEQVTIVKKVQPVPEQEVRPAQTPTPVVVDQVAVEEGTLPVETVVDVPVTDIALPIGGSTGPVTGMQLEYGDAPSPPYPRIAIQQELEGVVLLQILVDLDGKPLEVTIHRSSGHRVLDREAQRHVLRHWTFRPATKDGQPVQAIGIVPIDFKLNRS